MTDHPRTVDQSEHAKAIRRISGAHWPWAIATIFCAALVTAGIATSQGFKVLPPNNAIYDSEPPPVAGYLMDTESLSETYGERLVLVTAGPPQEKLITSDTPLAYDARTNYVVGGWQANLRTFDGRGRVQLTLTEYATHKQAAEARGFCKPKLERGIPGLVGITGVAGSSDTTTWSCADIRAHRTKVEISTSNAGVDHLSRSQRATIRIARAQDALIPDMVDLPIEKDGKVSMQATHISILRAWMVSLLALAAITTIPLAMLDRTWQQRLLGLRRRVATSHDRVDVSRQSAYMRRQVATLGLARLAMLVWTLRVAEIANLPAMITGVALVLVYVGCILLERLILSRYLPMHRVRLFRGKNAVIVATGALLALLIIFAAANVWTLGMTMSAFAGIPEVPDWQVRRLGLVVQLISFGVLAIGALVPLTIARRVAMTRLRTTPEPDGRPPVLLLRSFTDDRIRIRSRRIDRASILDRLAMRRRDRFEEVLASAAAKYGPVVACGTPGERLAPPLGALRRQLPADDWQGAVQAMADKAKFIVLVVGRSEGTVWEMRHLVSSGLAHKSLIVIPPVGKAEQQRRAALVSAIFDIPWDLLDVSSEGRCLLLVTLPLASPARAYVSAAADDLSYDIAVASALSDAESSGVDHDVLLPRRNSPQVPALPVRASHQSRRPALEVIPAGSYRPKKTHWSLRVWSINLALGLVVIPTIGAVLYGYASGFTDKSGRLSVHDTPDFVAGGPVTAAALVQGRSILEANFKAEPVTSRPVGDLPTFPTEVVAYQRMLIWVSLNTGQAGAASLDTGKQLWIRKVGVGVRGLSVDQSRVHAVVPGKRKVVELDRQTGSVRAQHRVSGHPWGTATNNDGKLAVAIIDRPELVIFDSKSPADPETIMLPSPARAVVNWNHRWWAVTDHGRSVSPVGMPDAKPIRMSDQDGAVVALDSRLAIQGVERISVFTDFGVRRFLTRPNVWAIGLLDDGSLVVVEEYEVTRRAGRTANG